MVADTVSLRDPAAPVPVLQLEMDNLLNTPALSLQILRVQMAY